MKILFTFSRSSQSEHSKTFTKVLSELERQGLEVEATFRKDHYPDEYKNIDETIVDSEGKFRYIHDKAVRRAIFRTDAVVIEASYQSFRLGFEAFYALTKQKPVLVLSKFRNYSNLIDQPHFFGAKYADFTLPDEIEKFKRHVEHYKLRNRFNLFISDNHKQHLEKSAKHYGVSMSDFMRKLIETDMEK